MKNQENIKLLDSERQLCEVWTRVMGYYRPVENYNPGKRSEYEDRQCFIEPKSNCQCEHNSNLRRAS